MIPAVQNVIASGLVGIAGIFYLTFNKNSVIIIMLKGDGNYFNGEKNGLINHQFEFDSRVPYNLN